MKVQRLFSKIAIAFFASFAMVSCVDDSYDVSKDIDMTIGLGTDGLELKLGNTERIFLKDVLEVDDTEMLDTTKNSLYYLLKTGSTNISVDVSDVPSFEIDDMTFKPSSMIMESTTSDLNLTTDMKPSVQSYNDTQNVEINVKGILSDIKEMKTIVPEACNLQIAVMIDQPSTSKLKISKMRDLSIKFPNYIYSSAFKEGTHTFYRESTTSTIFTIPIDSISFKKDGKFGKIVKNEEVTLIEPVTVTSSVETVITEDFTLESGSSISSKINATFPIITPETFSGLIDPEINPEIETINISDDLPEFLQDESVTLKMVDVTVEMNTENGVNIPVPLTFQGKLSSIKNNVSIADVMIPSTEKAEIDNYKDSYLYFSQTDSPFLADNQTAANAKYYVVPKLSELVEKIPDEVKINFQEGKITTDQTKLHQVTLGRSYDFSINYKIYMPFSFNKDLSIVYNDSTDNMNKDLEDLQANSVTITATANNTVPLDLKLELLPYGVDGEDLSSIIKIATIIIPAATTGGEITTSNIIVTGEIPVSSDLSKLDKLVFKVTASAINSDKLYSNQYIELKDLRLKLNGQIIGNFN